jgi:hypothetical protein
MMPVVDECHHPSAREVFKRDRATGDDVCVQLSRIVFRLDAVQVEVHALTQMFGDPVEVRFEQLTR